MLRRNANSGDEEGGLGVDDNVDKFVEFTLGVVVTAVRVSNGMRSLRKVIAHFVFLALPPT